MSQDPLVGHVLGGARLEQRVSKGLLADVYRGHYERLGVPVAVKVLSPKAMAQGVNKERFIREGRALAQLQHPNIIKIYNVGHEHGRYFIIMDWIQDGMNLRQLAQQRPLTPPQSLKVVQRLCDALTYIHARSMIHRDIKPANICLRRGGHPVIMDFSLMKDQSSDVQLTAPGTIMGTVNFMPPEQAQPGAAFGNVSPRSDVYSLGGTLYWLLTGKAPFKGRTPMETIIKLMREEPQAPSNHNPSLPPVIDQLVLDCMSKKQEGRPESAEAFKQRLEELFRNYRAELEQCTRPGLADSSGNAGGKKATSGRQQVAQRPQPPHQQQPGMQPIPQGNPGSSWGNAQQQQSRSGSQRFPREPNPAGGMQPAAHGGAPGGNWNQQQGGPPGSGRLAQPAAVMSPPQSASGSGSGEHMPPGAAPAQPFSPSMSTEGAAAGLLRMPEGGLDLGPVPTGVQDQLAPIPEPKKKLPPPKSSRSSRRKTAATPPEGGGSGRMILIIAVIVALIGGGIGAAFFFELI